MLIVMGQWLSWVKSNEKELLSLLTNLAKKSVETSEAVVVLFDDLSNAEQVQKIHRLETEADVLTRDIFSELNRTFITPLDREDMQRIVVVRTYYYHFYCLLSLPTIPICNRQYFRTA